MTLLGTETDEADVIVARVMAAGIRTLPSMPEFLHFAMQAVGHACERMTHRERMQVLDAMLAVGPTGSNDARLSLIHI